MRHFQHIFGLLFVSVLCCKTSEAIKCYQCNSVDDKRCLGDENNKLAPNMALPCPDKTADNKPYILCRKIKQAIDFEVNGMQPHTRIIRSCGWDNSTYGNRCYHRSGFGGRQEVCACQSNDCNTAATALVAPALLLLGALLALNVRV